LSLFGQNRKVKDVWHKDTVFSLSSPRSVKMYAAPSRTPNGYILSVLEKKGNFS
jgi:hypothetical protein